MRGWRLAGGFGGLLVACLVLPASSGPRAQQLVRSEDAVVALFSLQTEMEVDNKMLRRMELRLEENRAARIEARERVERLYAELDDLMARYSAAIQGRQGRGDGPEEEPASLERLETQIEAKALEVRTGERAEAAVSDEGHRLRDDIRNLKERITLLSAQIDSLAAGLPAQKESVTGVWDVTLLPSGEKGVFALFQSGTIVSGQYVLDGPFQGSLDGTLVDRKLLLHRIDSRLGRSMDLTASLSQDGQSLRGTWENYDLANGQARSGSWAARRRAQRKASSEAESRESSPR